MMKIARVCGLLMVLTGCFDAEQALTEIEANYLEGCQRAVASELTCASGITGGVETADGCPAWASAKATSIDPESQTCITLELELSRCFANADEICNTLGAMAPVGECMDAYFALDDGGCF